MSLLDYTAVELAAKIKAGETTATEAMGLAYSRYDLLEAYMVMGVFGNDYDTPDGTGVRDYIHVVDLAKGHVAAINKIKENPGVKIYNLGTGKGYSVLDVIHAFGKACGKEIPYEIKPRRAGDIATCYSDASLAKKELGWEAQYDIDEMCADSWKWFK